VICLSQWSASNDTQRHACLLQQPVCWSSNAQQRGISEKVNGMKNYREHPTSIWKTTEAAVKCEFHACTSIHVKGKRDEMDGESEQGWVFVAIWLTFVKPKRERGACTAKAAQLVPPAPRPFHPSSRRRNLFLSLCCRCGWFGRCRVHAFAFRKSKGTTRTPPPWGPVQY
jgi:hypothetical protein